MKRFVRLCLLGVVTFLFCINNSYASFIGVDDGKPNWQQLDARDDSGLGVLWKVSNDDGATWGDFGRETDLYVGQTVQFQFNMYKPTWGGHAYDFLKAWAHMADPVTGAIISTFETTDKDYLFFNQEPVTEKGLFTYTDNNTYTLSTAGDLFLRARVTCSSALLHSNYDIGEQNYGNVGKSRADSSTVTWKEFQQQWDPDYRRYQRVWRKTYENMFTSSIELPDQGETEDYRIIVHTPTPEPATMFLFGAGLIGLAGVSRRRKNK